MRRIEEPAEKIVEKKRVRADASAIEARAIEPKEPHCRENELASHAKWPTWVEKHILGKKHETRARKNGFSALF